MNTAAGARLRWPRARPGLRGWLNGGQFSALMLVSVFPTIILLVPADLVRMGGRYGWWTPLAAAPPAMILAWGAGRLAGRRGGSVRAALHSLGPMAGRAVLAALWAGVGFYVTVILREFAQTSLFTIVTGAMPIWVMVAVGVSASGLMAWWGPVVLGRTAAVVAPALVAVFLMIVVATLPSTHVIWALQLWPQNTRFAGWPPLVRMWVWTAEPAFLAAVMIDHTDAATRRTTGRSLAGVVLSVTVLTALLTWLIVAKLGPQGATLLALPLSGIVENLGFGPYVLNLETAVFPIVTMGAVIKLAVFLWVWARLGSGLAGIPLKTALLVQSAGAACLSLAISQNVVGLDRTFSLLGGTALPALVAGTLLAYVRVAPRRRSPRA